MRILRVRVADVAGGSVTGAQGTVTVEPWNDGRPFTPRLVAGGVLNVPAVGGFNRDGVADIEVLANDDESIVPDDRGFGYRVTVELSAPDPVRGTRRIPSLVRTIIVTSDDPDVVDFGTKVPAVPVVPAADYATQAEGYAAGYQGGTDAVGAYVDGPEFAGALDQALDAKDLLPRPEAAETYALRPTNGAQAVGVGELVVNVRDYGATGDGSTNDQAAIQAAINAAGPVGRVLFPPGTYRITSGVTVGSGLTLYAATPQSATLFTDGAFNAVTIAAGASGVRISGLRFLGTMPENGIATTSAQCGIYGFATAANRITDLRVTDCRFDDIQGSCILLKHVQRFRIDRNDFARYGYAAVGIYSGHDGNIGDNDMTGTGNLTTYDPNSYGIFLSVYKPDGSWGSASNPQCSDIRVHGNNIRNQAWEGIDTHSALRVSIVGNHLRDCHGRGIAVVGLDSTSSLTNEDIAITGNVVTYSTLSTSTGQTEGIVMRGSARRVTGRERCTGTIVGNTVHRMGALDSNVSGGIMVANGSGVVVASNKITECRSHGVLTQDCVGTVVQGNTVTDVWRTSGTSAAVTLTQVADSACDAVVVGNQLLRGPLTVGTDIPSGSNVNTAGYYADPNAPSNVVTQAGNAWPAGSAFSASVRHRNPLTRGYVEFDGTGPPTSGTWLQGDRVRHTSPAAGGAIGWVCTSGGTPGTWRAYGTIS